MSNTVIPSAQLSWHQNSHPHSTVFDDHYYSLVDGLEESHHVFIEGNDLIKRWRRLQGGQSFCIFETGFGSAVNFLATWRLWKKYNHGKHNQLHYISVEAYPMTAEQLEKSLRNWNKQLGQFSQQLLNNYPPLTAGIHDIDFANNIKLTLIFADIRTMLPEINDIGTYLVDAWYLDGFSPSKNPQMWGPDLYQQIQRLSKPTASIATYTVAGIVRRGLTDAGFIIERKPGFGTKRDMLTALNGSSC